MQTTEINNYFTIGKKNWGWILRHNQREYTPSLSTHVPIHPVFARDLVHVECGLNVVRRRVFPGLSIRKVKDRTFLANTEAMFVEFAFNDPPFVPASELSRLSLEQNQYPIITGKYYALDLNYKLEYLCLKTDDFHSILGIRVSVFNEAPNPQKAHVWAKVNFQLEKKVMDYHYKPYYWDNSRWPDCKYRMGLKKNRILKSGKPIGRIIPNGFTCTWEKKRTFSDREFKFEGCERPYLPKPNYRLKKVTDVLHCTTNLKPGREKSFTLVLQVNHEDITGK
jgi:hypothetical protein